MTRNAELADLVVLGMAAIAAAAKLGLGAGGLVLAAWFLLFERRFHAKHDASRR